MAFSQFGTNSAARRKRVYYTETSTIYEGMPVCYDYDATTNILGYDKAAGGDASSQSSPTTTAEGYQNEGKFLRVEDPTDNNLMHFAGVVAGTSYAGLIGPRWLDIYIPNGAIVPVRCDVDTTVGITVLAITVDSQELGQPISGTSRPVAIAMETETDLDSTAGITLAKLDPNLFTYQNLDGTALSIGAGTASLRLNEIVITTAHTGGYFNNFLVLTTDTGDMAAAGGVCGINSTTYITGSQTSGGYNRAILATLSLAGSTLNSGSINVFGLMAQLTGSLTNTEVGHCSGAMIEWALSEAPNTGKSEVLYLYAAGAENVNAMINMSSAGEQCDYIFDFNGLGGSSGSTVIKKGGTGGMWTNTGAWVKIKIAVDGTDYYIPAGVALTEA